MARRVVKTGDGEIAAPKEKLRPGDAIADFELRDQHGQMVRLSDFRGKVVAIDFIYTRCPLPDVCPRLSASFATLQKRFAGRDLVLLSITVDPEYDTPAVLAEYARRWGADSRGWRFLTGDVARRGRRARGSILDGRGIDRAQFRDLDRRARRPAGRRGGWVQLARRPTVEPDRARTGGESMRFGVLVTRIAGGVRPAEGRQLRAAAERARADPAREAPVRHGDRAPEDHHVQPRGAGVLRPGTGADALVLGARGGAVVRCRRRRSTRRRRCRSGASRWWRRATGGRGSSSISRTRSSGRQPPPAMSRARTAAQKAVELSANGTDLERMYIAAVAARRDPAAKDPEEAFVQGTRALLAKYPEEVEAQLDLALIDDARLHPAGQEADRAGVDGSGRDSAQARGQGSGPPGRAPLHHPRLRGLDLRQGRMAELREIRATGPEHPARAAHAGAHLLADGPVGGRGEVVSTRRRRTSAIT